MYIQAPKCKLKLKQSNVKVKKASKSVGFLTNLSSLHWLAVYKSL